MSEIEYTAELKGSLKLSKNGEWWHNGVAFQREALSNLFHRSIIWDEVEKQYFVKIGRQRARFDVEDTAYFVTELLDETRPWHLKLNDGSEEDLKAQTLCLGSEDQIYCQVKDYHRARFSRSAHQRLLSHAVDERNIKVNDQLIQLIAVP